MTENGPLEKTAFRRGAYSHLRTLNFLHFIHPVNPGLAKLGSPSASPFSVFGPFSVKRFFGSLTAVNQIGLVCGPTKVDFPASPSGNGAIAHGNVCLTG